MNIVWVLFMSCIHLGGHSERISTVTPMWWDAKGWSEIDGCTKAAKYEKSKLSKRTAGDETCHFYCIKAGEIK